MKKTLFIVKNRSDAKDVFEFILEQIKTQEAEPTLILIQEASQVRVPPPIKAHILSEKPGRSFEALDNSITYKEMLDFIFSTDSLVVW
ncbi:MAG TPA: hypothetical protein VGB26_11055 [Nitrospiria bacterium]